MKFLKLLTLLLLPVLSIASPRIVTSIAPIHSIVSQISYGVTEPELLVPSVVSPHEFQLTPQSLQALTSADLVIWVGDGVEAFMNRASRRVEPENQMALNALVGELLPMRDHGHDHDHDHGHYDEHIWLSIEKAKQVAQVVADRLADIDPQNQATYQTNLSATLARLDELDGKLMQQLSPIAGVPYVVFHDAYQYLEEDYGLTSIAAVMSPNQAGSSLSRQFALRKMLAEQNVECVFSEPQFSDQRVQRLVGNNYRVAVLDPIGVSYEPGIDLYENIMQGLATSLVDCLGENK